MYSNQQLILEYLEDCRTQKRLNDKTLHAYLTDLTQFIAFIGVVSVSEITSQQLQSYVRHLNSTYKPKTVKRKIASIKAFYRHLEYHEIVSLNPWRKVQCKFREPQSLPRTIPLYVTQSFFSCIYKQINYAGTLYQRRNALRDAAVCELLFATGMRIFELCALTPADINLNENIVLIHGKRSKERIINIGNKQVHDILVAYKHAYMHEIQQSNHFFVNQKGRPFSDQAVRRMMNHYASIAHIEQHITPHMWRHTFATELLNADVDIRYIQQMLGHSSIRTTEIYTHCSTHKQKEILEQKHPRNAMSFERSE